MAGTRQSGPGSKAKAFASRCAGAAINTRTLFERRHADIEDIAKDRGMLEGYHFQNAYVTRDIAKGIEAFRKRAKVDKEIVYEGSSEVMTPSGPATQTNKLAFLWVGDLQYELIEPVSGAVDIYRDGLPEDDGLKFHHICMRVDDWDEFRARVDQQPCPIVIERDSDPSLKFLYLDARDLVGHYLEYVWMTDERWAQMGGR